MSLLAQSAASAARSHGLRGRLLGKYVAFFAAAVSLALVADATFDTWFYYREYRNLLFAIQRAQAEDAAARINQAFGEIESQIGWVSAEGFDQRPVEDWRFDFARLLRQAAAVATIAKTDATGRERLRISRDAADASGRPVENPSRAAPARKTYGPVEFRPAGEFFVLTVPDANGGASIADIDLKHVFAAVERIKFIDQGRVYLLDAGNRLMFDSAGAPAGSDYARLMQVQAARAATEIGAQQDFQDGGGRAVLSAYARVVPFDWLVFVELPVTAAHAPLFPLLFRSGVHLVLALILAILAGVLLARRMVGPIEVLRAGAARVGAGDLSHRIAVTSRDELGALGDQFNHMAAQLAESYASLESKVAARTHDLARANLAKSRFLAVASHDLRQPLHALGLFVAELRAQRLEPESRRIVARIDAAVAAMNDLFGALLDISRLDAGVLAPSLSDFPLAHLFARIEATFAAAARAKGLSLRVAASSAFVRSDVILLERILINLTANAVRYTAHGGVVVGCRRRGDNLRIEVWDTGPGIAPEQQREIFAEFIQLAPLGQDRDGGLGLGLAIVDRLCGLLGHRLALRSRLGKGSCFSIEVPAAAPVDLAVLPPSRDLPAGKLVVVIEDDPLVLEGMGSLMRSWGCGVVTAPSADEAIARLATLGQPDLIISDYRLADRMTGIAAIARLRAVYKLPVAAFLISADTAPERLREAQASGLHLLHKPVRPMALRAMVTQLLLGDVTAG